MDPTPLFLSMVVSVSTIAGAATYLRRPFDGRAWLAFLAVIVTLAATAWLVFAAVALAANLPALAASGLALVVAGPRLGR